MKNFRTSFIIFLICLSFFFNIERWDFGRENIIDIDSIVYIIGLVAVLSVISVPVLRNNHVSLSLVIWVGIYIASKLVAMLLFDKRPLLGGIYTYLSITELTLLILIIWLAHKLATGLHDFEESVERITFADSGGRIRQLQEANEEIQIEMYRSRHNHRPLSVLIIEPNMESVEASLHHAVQEVQQSMMRSYVINSIAQMLGKYLRRTDIILEQRAHGRFMILCPETNAGNSKLLAEYIETVTTQQAGISVECGIATFPDEALTFDELVRQAEARIGNPAKKTPQAKSRPGVIPPVSPPT